MAWLGKLLIKIAAFTVAALTYSSATAATFTGAIPVGYSDNLFQIGQGTSILSININAIGMRDPSLCPSCDSAYTDNFTVNLFDQSGALVRSTNATNFLWFDMFSSSHGIGAGPISFAVPSGVTTLEIISQLSIVGLLGFDGQPLGFGNLFIGSDGSIMAATPIPSTLPLLATGLAVLGVICWRRRRQDSSAIALQN